MTELTRIDFHGATLLAMAGDSAATTMVAMKPLFEGAGVPWEAQRQRIAKHPVLNKATLISQVPSERGLQDAVFLPLDKVDFALATLHPDRVKDPAARANLILYQTEAAAALYAHFQPQRDGKRVTLRDVGGVVKAVTHKELMESEERARTENRAEMAVLKAELAKIAEAYDPTRTVSIMYRLANYYVIQAGVAQKGRRGFTTKCSNRLLKFAGREIPDQPGKNRMHLARTSNESGKWTFHMDLWREWLIVEGNTLIREHKDAQTGQSVLKLVPPAKKPV